MSSEMNIFGTLFSREQLDQLLPMERTDQFFDALLGDSTEGAYDIRLGFKGCRDGQLHFELELHQRPGKCLACNLTYGLPAVFTRHPVIDVAGLVARIDQLMDGHGRCAGWRLGATREISRQLHVVPLVIDIDR